MSTYGWADINRWLPRDLKHSFTIIIINNTATTHSDNSAAQDQKIILSFCS